jgi:predicted metal-dependent peptidase
MSIYHEVTKFSKSLMLKEPFYGLFLISLNKELTTSIPTACVTPDNINIKLCINPDFWESLDENTKLGVLKHELLHIAFFHLQNFDRFPNKKLYNVAADLEINQYIQADYKGEKWDGLEFDEGIYKPLNLLTKQGTKYYYEKLQDELDNNPNGDFADFMNGMEIDIHELWEAMEGMSEAERKLIGKQVDHQLKEIASQLEKRAKDRGLIPSEMKDYISSLFEVQEPVLDWKAYLRRFSNTSNKVFTKKTRRKPNKRFYGNPALKIKLKKSTLVAIDTSGSVSNSELAEFFNEIYHIYKTGTKVTVVECDAAIQRVYEYKGNLEDLSVQGRGGTDFEPVMQYLVEHRNEFDNLIYLTDGECSSPATKPLKPILWVHSSRSKINEELPGTKIKIN